MVVTGSARTGRSCFRQPSLSPAAVASVRLLGQEAGLPRVGTWPRRSCPPPAPAGRQGLLGHKTKKAPSAQPSCAPTTPRAPPALPLAFSWPSLNRGFRSVRRMRRKNRLSGRPAGPHMGVDLRPASITGRLLLRAPMRPPGLPPLLLQPSGVSVCACVPGHLPSGSVEGRRGCL